MLTNLRLALAIALAFLVVAVDFSSKLLSIAADGLLVGVCLMVLWPLLKAANKPKQ